MPRKSRQIKTQQNRPAETLTLKTASIPPSSHKPWQIAAVSLVLTAVTVLAYSGVRNNDFLTYDDGVYVSENHQVQMGVNPQSIAWAFTTFHGSNWHPLTWISHMVDWSLYGRNPAGHHITNVLFHAANAVLLFLLLLYITGYLGRAAIVAFLFAVHPAHVESVAWLAERKDLLCAFFSLIALLAYAWYARSPSWKRFAWVVLASACALLSKPMAVTLPFIMLLLDYWPLRRFSFTQQPRAVRLSSLSRLCIEKWPLFVLATFSSIVTFKAQQSGGSVIVLEAFPMWVRISNAAISYCRYLRIAFWPHPLIAYYYHDRIHIAISAAVLSAIALFLVTAICWRMRETRPYCLFGWLWFLGTLVPVIGIVQVGVQAMAERYTYLPFIGIFIAVVWLAGDAVANSPKLKVAAHLLAIAVILACAVETSAQVKVWKNTATLFTHVLQVDPRGELPNSSLGVQYLRQGKLAESLKYFDQALVYNPYGAMTLSYSAYALMQTHDRHNLQVAGQRIQRALSITPNDFFSLANLGLWSAYMGRPHDQEIYSRKALAIDPNFAAAHLYLADALQARGKLDEAAQQCRLAIALEPNNSDAHISLGSILNQQGLNQNALNEFRLSLAIQHAQPAVYYKIGSTLLAMHRFPEAIEAFNQSLDLDTANAHAHNDLGVALSQLGDYARAAEQFNRAVQLDPSYVDAKRNLALAQSRMKN